MIENWKSAHKMASNWVFLLIGALGGLEQLLPAIEGMVPPGVYAVLMTLGIVARLWKQKSLQTPESIARELDRAREVWDEAMRAKDGVK